MNAEAEKSPEGPLGVFQPGTIHDDVVVGFDGYLFLAEGRPVAELVESVEERIEDGAYEAFRQNLENRLAWAARHAAQYLHVIVPERSSIARNAFPFAHPPRVGEAFLGWTPNLAEHILYPLEALVDELARTLSPVDSHLSDYGAILVAALAVEKLSDENQVGVSDPLLRSVQSEGGMTGDLGSRFDPPFSSMGEWLFCDAPGKSFVSDCEYGETGTIHLRFNDTPYYNKRVVVFGDSAAREIVRMLQFWFREVLFFCSDYFHNEVANFCKPDVVLFISSERYVGYRRLDVERSNFFLYRLGTSHIVEPAGFRRALNVVLDFPRKPFSESNAQPFAAWVAPEELAQFDSLVLTDRPAEMGLVRALETPTITGIKPPAFVEDLSGRNLSVSLPSTWPVHGSYLTQHGNVLLFGQSYLVSPQGYWSGESRSYKEVYIPLVRSGEFPGVGPKIEPGDDGMTMATSHFRHGQVERIEEPVFLATPLEPGTWGRWVATVAPKIAQFRQFGGGRKFFCMAQYPWQKQFLNLFGLEDDVILDHYPGRTYLCQDVMTVEYSVADLMVSADERLIFADLTAKHRVSGASDRRLFISRKSISERHSHYRVLQNEHELSVALAKRGFDVVDPETLSIGEQIDLYASAKHVVSLGGSALFNIAFCATGTKIVTIESSIHFIDTHARFLASLGLDFGVIFGEQDLSDPLPIHKRWTIDVERACAAIEKFMR